MNQQIIIWLSEWALLVMTASGLVVILGASLYDMQAIARRRQLLELAAKLRKPRQPHITVLVYTKNSSATIAACLTSVWRSHYRNYDIVVIDNISTDTTKQVIANYRQKHSKLPLYFYVKRKASDRLSALRQGYAKSQKGDIVLILDATATVLPSFLRQSAVRFVADPSLGALRPNEYQRDIAGLALLLGRLLQLSRNMTSKFAALLSIMPVDNGQVNTLYRKSFFVKNNKTLRIFCRYDGGLVVSLSVNNLRFSLILPLIAALFMTYFMYVAATLQSSSLLAFSWLIVAVWLLVAIWSDEAASRVSKAVLSFCMPAVYFLVYLSMIGQLVFSLGRLVIDVTLRLSKFESEPNVLAERKL